MLTSVLSALEEQGIEVEEAQVIFDDVEITLNEDDQELGSQIISDTLEDWRA
jgi:hypothetical protein